MAALCAVPPGLVTDSKHCQALRLAINGSITCVPGFCSSTLTKGRRHQTTLIGQRGIRLRNLQRRYRQTITIGNRRFFNRTPTAWRRQNAGGFARESAIGALSITKAVQHIVQMRITHVAGEFCCTDIRRHLQQALQRHHAVIAGIANRVFIERHDAGIGIDTNIRINAILECCGHR